MFIFQDVCLADLENLVRLCPVRNYRVGETVMLQGSEASCAMILVEGKLGVGLEGDDGNMLVGAIHSGEIFGEQGLFHGKGFRNATVSAARNSICLMISPELMRNSTGNAAMAALERQLIAALARRIRRTNLGLQKSWKESAE